MRSLMVSVKIEKVDGARTAQWTGSFSETVLVVVPDTMDGEAFDVLIQHYVEAGVKFAEMVRCG